MESLKLPTDWPELGNHWGGFLGLAAEPVAEMMCLFSRTEPANHTTQMHLDGWSTEQLCYQLWIQLPVCLPTSWMKVYHYDWHQRGIKGAKIRVKMCVRGRRETKKITVLKNAYIYLEHTKEYSLKLTDLSGIHPLRMLRTNTYTKAVEPDLI